MLVCTLMTAVLAVINHFTAPLIAEGNQKKRVEILSSFYPNMANYTEVSVDIDAVQNVYEIENLAGALLGYCVNVVEKGYAGDVEMMVAIGSDLKILGVRLVSHSETKGLSEKKEAEALSERFENKVGKQSFTDKGGEIDKIAGATYSSKAVLDGVNHAVSAVEIILGGGAEA